tara:strand:+ start:1873 stop:2091 length:219 start_codon:yes stop_codon:yes gene_type:complete
MSLDSKIIRHSTLASELLFDNDDNNKNINSNNIIDNHSNTLYVDDKIKNKVENSIQSRNKGITYFDIFYYVS